MVVVYVAVVFVGGSEDDDDEADCAERFNKLDIKLLADIVWVCCSLFAGGQSFFVLRLILTLGDTDDDAGIVKIRWGCIGFVDAVAAANKAARALLPFISFGDEAAFGEAVIVKEASLGFLIEPND